MDRKKLLSPVPDSIKDWTGSDEVAEIIIQINDAYSLRTEADNSLSLIIFLLETKQLPPEQLSSKLNHILQNPSIDSPKVIQTIKTQILEPIRQPLLDYGIDINLIQPGPSITSPTAPTPTQIAPAPITEPVAPTATPPADQPIPPRPTPTDQPSPASAPSPYILHEEAAFKTLSEEHNINYEPIRQAFFSSSQASAPAFKQPIMPAKIQFGGHKEEIAANKNPSPAKTEAFIPKIIHYSALKTPVNPFDSQAPASETPNIPTIPPVAVKVSVIPPTKFNDRVIENASKEIPASAAQNKKIDLKDLPL